MPRPAKSLSVNYLALAVLAAAVSLGNPSIAANDGAAQGAGWTVSSTDQDHPSLRYADGKKTVFMMGCDQAFVVRAAFPDVAKRPKKANEKSYITIENGKSQMNLTGVLQAGSNDELPADTMYFVQSDLGYDHNSSATYGPAWQKRQAKLLDFLDSGRALTISAAGKVYVLPAIKITDWKTRLKKAC
jgi:hypothetical protein